MGLLGNLLKRSRVESASRQRQRPVYEPPKRYTPEEFVIYEQEQSGECWHGVHLSELSKLAQTTYRGRYVKVDQYGFLVFHYASNSRKTKQSIQCEIGEDGLLRAMPHGYYPGQCLDTIYIDKPIQQHTLIQTISRVNRVYEGKDKGLIVDYIGIKKNMNLALKRYTNFESDEFEGIEQSITIVKDQLDVLHQMFHNFNDEDYFEGTPLEQLNCLNRAVEYVQLSEEMELRFMAAVRRMKQAYNLCSSSDKISDRETDYIHFYSAVRSILFKLTKGDAPDITQMNARVREMVSEAIHSDGVEELFEAGKHINVEVYR